MIGKLAASERVPQVFVRQYESLANIHTHLRGISLS